MARRIHIANIPSRTKRAATPAPSPVQGNDMQSASVPSGADEYLENQEDDFIVRLAGDVRELNSREFQSIALEAARNAAQEERALDMNDLLRTAREFHGESMSPGNVLDDSAEKIESTRPPLVIHDDLDDDLDDELDRGLND